METVIDVKGLCKTYIVNKYSNNVLRNIDFRLEEGEFVSIMGPSGSGKSTMLYTVSGMDRATSGDVMFLGKNLGEMNDREMAKERLVSMGFIFQQMYMMRKLCILDNILLPVEDRVLLSQQIKAEKKETAKPPELFDKVHGYQELTEYADELLSLGGKIANEEITAD